GCRGRVRPVVCQARRCPDGFAQGKNQQYDFSGGQLLLGLQAPERSEHRSETFVGGAAGCELGDQLRQRLQKLLASLGKPLACSEAGESPPLLRQCQIPTLLEGSGVGRQPARQWVIVVHKIEAGTEDTPAVRLPPKLAEELAFRTGFLREQRVASRRQVAQPRP